MSYNTTCVTDNEETHVGVCALDKCYHHCRHYCCDNYYWSPNWRPV